MMQIVEKKYSLDCLSELHVALTNGKINKIKIETIINALRGLIHNQPPIFFNRNRIKALNRVIDFCIKKTALNCGLYLRAPSKELALISGAGIAGLAASFVLLARGFKVVIAEKRETFNRCNVINLNVETQVFLKKYNLLKEFEACVAARIKEHRCVVVGKTNSRHLPLTDVSKLQLDESVVFEPENFNKLFSQDGIYSVPIGVLQTFLASKALEAGVHIIRKAEVKILARTPGGGVSKVQITGKDNPSNSMILQPHLFFVAEGVHSTTVDRLGMVTNIVENECTGENWIFGNVEYSGKETFVVSIIDASQKNLKIANVIFNAMSQVINVAVTSNKALRQDHIRELILRIVQQTFHLANINSTPRLLTAVKEPVQVTNKIASHFSMDNVFRIGDAAGHSSPLAGLGGTLSLSLVPRTILQLLDDREQQPEKIQSNFKLFSEAYIARWNEKSRNIKNFCLNQFKKEQTCSEGNGLILKEEYHD